MASAISSAHATVKSRLGDADVGGGVSQPWALTGAQVERKRQKH